MPPLSRLSHAIADTAGAFSGRRQPLMVRRNYVYELKSAATFPLAAALAEGTFTGVVAAKYFDAGLLLIAVITAAPMFGNILALLWAELAETRPKVPFINGLQLGVALSMAAVAGTYFIDDLAVAGWMFAGLIIIARVLASGIITLRSAVWRLNYPRRQRAQIIGRINGVYNTVLSTMVLAAAFALDRVPGVYAIIYPAVAIVSLFGVLHYSRIRVRGERQLLRRARLTPAGRAVDESGNAIPAYDRVERDASPRGAVGRLAERIRDAFALLGRDKMFREYQWWQFLLGFSFMMMFPSLIYMVSQEMTDRATEYVKAVMILQFIPMVTGVIFLQVWAPLFDRTDIFTFRVWIGFAAISAHVLILAGALTDQLWLVAGGTFAVGVAMGGGQLAWQLGQNAFATKGNVGTYMGLHVMLTGLRGMVAPFLGVGIYHFLRDHLPPLGGVENGGRWVFFVPVTACAISIFGYVSMSRRYAGQLVDESDDTPSRGDRGFPVELKAERDPSQTPAAPTSHARSG